MVRGGVASALSQLVRGGGLQEGGGRYGWRHGQGRCSERTVAKHIGIAVLEEVHIVLHAAVGAVTLLETVLEVVEARVELPLRLLLLALQPRQLRPHRAQLRLQLADPHV